MNTDDIIFILVLLNLLIIAIFILTRVKSRERIKMSTETKARKDMIDLEAITKNIERDYKPLTIELTSYEQEQENNAIISYEELLSTKDMKEVNYDESYKNNVDIDVKKVDLSSPIGINHDGAKMNVTLMSYEKEEAFLKALKQLQRDLAS